MPDDLFSTQLLIAIAGAAGVIRGITGFGGSMVMTPPLALLFGPPVILYLLSGPGPVPITRANLTLYVVLLSVGGLIMLAGSGLLNSSSLATTLPLAPAFCIGVLLGGRLFACFSDLRFRQFTLVLLLVVSTGILLA